MMKQEIPELSLCLAHWFLRVWEFGGSGSSLTRNVKPANPANCHRKVREVKKIILHCRLWPIFWHRENNFCQQKQNLQSMGWGPESQADRVALGAVPGPAVCALCTLSAAVWAAKCSHAHPNCLSKLSKVLFAEESLRQEGDKGCQSLTHHKDKCTTFLPRELGVASFSSALT